MNEWQQIGGRYSIQKGYQWRKGEMMIDLELDRFGIHSTDKGQIYFFTFKYCLNLSPFHCHVI